MLKKIKYVLFVNDYQEVTFGDILKSQDVSHVFFTRRESREDLIFCVINTLR